MPTGIVQFFLEHKGYGYIRVPETREEFYVHRRQLKAPVKRGDRVRFVVRGDKHGLFAAEVERTGY
ncbi:MAG: cold shock domain-containing protein [Phaeodactylibacter sp.]|nr:cold shock domain-containing protein [Phaeodactylibacter sp.]MCB9293366.1 cold shock domain-containing protein [Lewinellaceae bacterium]